MSFIEALYCLYSLISESSMKDKFSIFSPTYQKTDSFEGAINFKKSPNKFAVYEPHLKPRQTHKLNNYQAFSSNNLQNIKKIPTEYSNLRQTLNLKANDFDSWMQEADKQKTEKSGNFLRNTMNPRAFPPSRMRFDSNTPETSEMLPDQKSTQQLSFPSEGTGMLGYSKKGHSFLGQSKSWHTLYNPRVEELKFREELATDSTENKLDWSSRLKNQSLRDTYSKRNNQAHEGIKEQIQELRKISRRNQEEKQHQKSTYQRKLSCNNQHQAIHRNIPKYLFRKKTQETDPMVQCFTPKLPKSTYEERFKQVGSPTSTNNSDSRSPPNRYMEPTQTKKKNQKLGLEEFAVGKTLGEGKFGVVMVAKHKKTGMIVALKKIPKALIKSHLMIDQLALQIRLQSFLMHRNILGIYGCFDDSTHLYLILEFMPQGTLYSKMKKQKILSEEQAAKIIKQLAQAIDYLHHHDIAHRDIKPENIVISNEVYKLCDFGWAALCNERRQTYCGTLDFTSPEILEGKEYDQSVDLWSLGVLAFELMTGKAPFYHMSRKQTIKNIINVEEKAVSYPETMSKEAISLIDGLIKKNPEERMKTSEVLKHPFLTKWEEQ